MLDATQKAMAQTVAQLRAGSSDAEIKVVEAFVPKLDEITKAK